MLSALRLSVSSNQSSYPMKKTTVVKIKKITKNRHSKRTKQVKNSDCQSTDENTSSFLSNQDDAKSIPSCLRPVFFMVREILNKSRYNIDTYLVCLKMLEKLKFEVIGERSRLLAAAIVLIAGKIHEFRTPKYSDMISWSGHSFNFQDLIKAEGQLLNAFNFEIPILTHYKTREEIQFQARKLEKMYYMSSPQFQ